MPIPNSIEIQAMPIYPIRTLTTLDLMKALHFCGNDLSGFFAPLLLVSFCSTLATLFFETLLIDPSTFAVLGFSYCVPF